MRGRLSGSRLLPTRSATAASASPSTPPLTLSSRLSTIAWRRISAAFAPSASRSATSFCRRIARTSISPARLTQAISSTTATARNSVRSSGSRLLNRLFLQRAHQRS